MRSLFDISHTKKNKIKANFEAETAVTISSNSKKKGRKNHQKDKNNKSD